MQPHRMALFTALCLVASVIFFAFVPEGVAAPKAVAQNWMSKGNKVKAGEFLGSNNAQPLVLKANKIEGLRIDTNGNVGIGTTSPTNKLTVAGIVQSTSGGFRFPDGTTQTTASVAGPNGWALGGNAGTNPSSNFVGTTDNQAFVLKTNNAERLRISSGGNIGIGTTTPAHKLSIIGGPAWTSNYWTGALELANGSALGWQANNGGQRFGIGQTNDGLLFFRTASNPGTTASPANYSMIISDAGNVGIGTTTPCATSKLHVYVGPSGFACNSATVRGESSGDDGVGGSSNSGNGVYGRSHIGRGVVGSSDSGTAVYGGSTSGAGVTGGSNTGTGVLGGSNSGTYIFEGIDNSTNNRRFAVARATGNVYADGSFSGPADFAEVMPVTGQKEDYALGDVLSIAPDGTIMLSTTPNATNLAGVFSAKPGFLGDTEIAAHGIEYFDTPNTQQRIAVALIGIVPVKVTDENGPIHPGDLLTTSSTTGHAMKAKPVVVGGVEIYPTGTILGKALASWDKGSGMIQVLVTLR